MRNGILKAFQATPGGVQFALAKNLGDLLVVEVELVAEAVETVKITTVTTLPTSVTH